MPRVTNSEHYRRHRFLQMLWREPGLDIFFALLPTPAQWQLHSYHQPDVDLDQASFTDQRLVIDHRDPALAHTAGKHFKLLESAFVAASREFGVDKNQMNRAVLAAAARNNSPIRPAKRGGKAGRAPSPVHIAVIAKPPDAGHVSRVFWRLAGYMADKDK